MLDVVHRGQSAHVKLESNAIDENHGLVIATISVGCIEVDGHEIEACNALIDIDISANIIAL